MNKIVKPGYYNIYKYNRRIITNILNDALVYCDNKKRGCNWTGKLEDLSIHLNVFLI